MNSKNESIIQIKTFRIYILKVGLVLEKKIYKTIYHWSNLEISKVKCKQQLD